MQNPYGHTENSSSSSSSSDRAFEPLQGLNQLEVFLVGAVPLINWKSGLSDVEHTKFSINFSTLFI